MCQIDLRSYVSSEHVIHFLRSKSSPDLLDGHFDICLSFPVPFNVNYFNSYTHVPKQSKFGCESMKSIRRNTNTNMGEKYIFNTGRPRLEIKCSPPWDGITHSHFITCPALLTEMVDCIFKHAPLYSLSSFIK